MNQPDLNGSDGTLTGGRYRNWANVAYWLTLIAGCAVFLLMNFYTTIKEDDMFHSMIGGGSGRPINNLLDVLRSWVEYYKYDARTANLISFTFNGILGKTAFNVCNTLVFGLMAHMISRLATNRNSVMALVMLFTYMVTAMPVPGETLLWETGAFNYLWSFTASLVLLNSLKVSDKRPGWIKGVLLVVVSMFIGAMNEGTTVGFFGGMVLFYLMNREYVDRSMFLVMGGYLLGVLLLVTCPGAWDRASQEVAHDADFVSLIDDRIMLIFHKSIQYVTPAVTIVLMVLTLFVYGFKKTFISPVFCIFLAVLAFTFVVGKDQQRLYFSLAMFGLIIVISVVQSFLEHKLWLRVAVCAVGLLLCVMCYPRNIRTMRQYQAFFNEMEQRITQSGDSQVVLPVADFEDYSRFIKYFNFDSWNFLIREETLCYHYGKDNIQFVPDSVDDRYHTGRLLDGAVVAPFTAPDCDDVETVFDFFDQNYMAVKMSQDTISHSYQFAQAYLADGTPCQFPVSYFPLLYQGNEYLIFPKIDDEDVTRLVFSPYALDGPTITLQRADRPQTTPQSE